MYNQLYFSKIIKLAINFFLLSLIITLAVSIFIKNNNYKIVILLESYISLVALLFYSIFNTIIDNKEISNDDKIKDITLLRYKDWLLTTPVMLIALYLFMIKNANVSLSISTMIYIILSDIAMLLFGYLGELNVIKKIYGLIIGFIFFFIIFYLLYNNLLKDKYILSNIIIYIVFFVIWGLYGIVYMLDNNNMNILLSILDIIAKAFVGIGITTFYIIYN